MKFNVKNCPSYDKGIDECRSEYTEHICCWMNEDCPVKQIVYVYKNFECDCLIDKRKCGAMDNMPVCCEVIAKKDILNLLEIEEVE